jgi:hypothetical protein
VKFSWKFLPELQALVGWMSEKHMLLMMLVLSFYYLAAQQNIICEQYDLLSFVTDQILPTKKL